MTVLIDTPIWSLAFRRAKRPSNGHQVLEMVLRQLITRGRAVLIGAIRQEVLSGIRDEKAFDRLRDYLRHFSDEPLTEVDYEDAARFRNRCQAAGVTGSPTDFLLCAVAARRGMPIFTADKDFERYAKHLPIRLYEPPRPGHN